MSFLGNALETGIGKLGSGLKGVAGTLGFDTRSGPEKDAARIAQANANINVDPSLFQLRGGPQRGNFLQQQGQQATLRGSDFRGGQQQLLSQLQAQARGQGPSLAALQAQQAGNQGLMAQRAMAASAAPGQQGLAARLAAQQGANITGSIAGQSAMGRAQEQLGAMGQLQGALGNFRQQDINQMQTNDQARNELLRQELLNAQLMQQGGMAQQESRDRQLAALLGQAPQQGFTDKLISGAGSLIGL